MVACEIEPGQETIVLVHGDPAVLADVDTERLLPNVAEHPFGKVRVRAVEEVDVFGHDRHLLGNHDRVSSVPMTLYYTAVRHRIAAGRQLLVDGGCLMTVEFAVATVAPTFRYRVLLMTIIPLDERWFDDFIRLVNALADYEHLTRPDATAVARLRADAFGQRPRFEAALAVNADGTPVGYAIWLETYSSFLAKPTIYLEDLFVLEGARRSGAGGMLFDHVRNLGRQRGCGRMEWTVLDWNTLAREFYDRRQATWMKEWLLYRMTY
jgi:GNAT superfamily N-acetyltransferase